MTRTFTGLLLVLILAIVAGCGGATWVKLGGTQQGFYRDNSNCLVKSGQACGHHKHSFICKNNVYNSCMRGEGWSQEQKAQAKKVQTIKCQSPVDWLWAKGKYYYQAEMFRNTKDAKKLKKRISMAGMEAHIQSVSGKNKWYKVHVGPFEEELDMTQARKLLFNCCGISSSSSSYGVATRHSSYKNSYRLMEGCY